MSEVGQPERITQNRIVKLFKAELDYRYLGNWEERPENSNVEESILRDWLSEKMGYADVLIGKAIQELKITALNLSDGLYSTNKKTYSKLRYGIKIKAEVGENTETVKLIDWENPLNNDFAIAEEVTIRGEKEKRPDIVLYVNGIAIGVLELKNSRVSIETGIRQSITNQQDRFIKHFFSTVQFVFAGNDSEGLRYGTVGTPEKYFLQWKEDVEDNSRFQLDKYLLKMCQKERLIELMHDFVLFDGGKKKLPRVHQYFGIKAAQDHAHRREGGIIWHTQGSGKSIVMVVLAKWILENNPNARVAVITDRDELDKQIKGVFEDAGEEIYRTSSGDDLLNQLSKAKPRLLCSLIQKFGKKEVENFERYIKELESKPSIAVGELFVFVDECHRTQSNRLNRIMKARLPNAIFFGFTGTPLLKKDKKTSLEVFGKYIHTYKFNEAVTDEIVRDLIYEARDIDQRLSSESKVDAWFEAKTRGLNDFQTAELKKRWGTMQKVLSSKSRMEKIIADILLDFNKELRLASSRGNAILVASSIYEACKYYELFQSSDSELKGKVAVVTSYNPLTRHITTEDTGANTDTQKEYIYNVYTQLLKDVPQKPNKNRTEVYEDEVKEKFIKEPANMRLLIVVDKLLTGFDAPSCTYIYLDKSMQDHGLFQAICRVNRLDGEGKPFGHIIDYKNLFESVKGAISVYTSDLDYDHFKSADVDILLKARLEKGRERLDLAMEELTLLCEPVAPPKGALDYQHYFCGNTEIPDELKLTEPRRSALYKKIVAFIRAYANIADELEESGYSLAEIEDIKKELDFYLKLREEIKRASGETLDFKAYEADMRFMIDHYIQAEESEVVSEFGDLSLLEIIERVGIDQAIKDGLSGRIKGDREAVAEVIENNVRSKLVRERLIDPAFFERMSKVLDQIIQERRAKAFSYEEYLRRIAELVKQVQEGKTDDTPTSLNTPAKRALYNNLGEDEELTIAMDGAVRYTKKADWKGDHAKELEIKGAIYELIKDQFEDKKAAEFEVERIFKVIRAQEEY